MFQNKFLCFIWWMEITSQEVLKGSKDHSHWYLYKWVVLCLSMQYCLNSWVQRTTRTTSVLDSVWYLSFVFVFIFFFFLFFFCVVFGIILGFDTVKICTLHLILSPQSKINLWFYYHQICYLYAILYPYIPGSGTILLWKWGSQWKILNSVLEYKILIQLSFAWAWDAIQCLKSISCILKILGSIPRITKL